MTILKIAELLVLYFGSLVFWCFKKCEVTSCVSCELLMKDFIASMLVPEPKYYFNHSPLSFLFKKKKQESLLVSPIPAVIQLLKCRICSPETINFPVLHCDLWACFCCCCRGKRHSFSTVWLLLYEARKSIPCWKNAPSTFTPVLLKSIFTFSFSHSQSF